MGCREDNQETQQGSRHTKTVYSARSNLRAIYEQWSLTTSGELIPAHGDTIMMSEMNGWMNKCSLKAPKWTRYGWASLVEGGS